MEAASENPNKNLKRKKKRSAAQMAKKFARRRNYEGELDTETYQYMLRLLEIIRTEFPTMSDKQVFVDNVFNQSVGKEIEFAKNQVASRVLDTLIKYASFDTIVRFTESFNEVLRPFCSDRFASHVLQKLICVCADRGNKAEANVAADGVKIEGIVKEEDTVKVEDSEIKKYNEITLKLCKYVINNFEEFVWDTYANHVVRTAIECLGGLIDCSESDNNKKKMYPNLHVRRKVIGEYSDLLVSTCRRLHKLPQFQEFSHNDLTSGLLQSVLYSLKDIDSDLNSLIIKRICNDCFTPNEDNKLSDVFHSECSMRLLEAGISVSEPKDYTRLYERFFENHLRKLSLMKGANFSVQRLFEHCHMKETMEKIFDEVSEHLKEILEKGHTGVLASLAKACSRLHAKQGPFVNTMSTLFDCEANDRQTHIVPLVATLKTYEEYESLRSKAETRRRVPINLHGSLTVQAMLNFNKPIKLVNSLLGMSAEDLAEMLDDPRGSRIMDAFMESEYIGEKSRDKLARNLQGTWAKLARSTHGSRCLDKVWGWAKQSQQHVVMEELVEIGESLRSTNAGRVISAKLNVPLFARNKKEWSESQGKLERAKALFADIINNKK